MSSRHILGTYLMLQSSKRIFFQILCDGNYGDREDRVQVYRVLLGIP